MPEVPKQHLEPEGQALLGSKALQAGTQALRPLGNTEQFRGDAGSLRQSRLIPAPSLVAPGGKPQVLLRPMPLYSLAQVSPRLG